MADPVIKPDPETLGASPAAFTDEDIYEDAGDLEFNSAEEYQNLLLARVPKYVWDAWATLDDNAEIQIGTVRTSQVTNKNGTKRERLQLLLNSDIAQHQTVPKEYELDVTAAQVSNTFVFTEQDLPGFKSKAKAKFDLASANMPARLNRMKAEKQAPKPPPDKIKRFQPYYRKAIPKKTAINGRIAREFNCVVVENEESQKILSQRTQEAMKPRAGTKFISDDVSTIASGFLRPGADQPTSFDSFIKTGRPKAAKTSQEAKTTRIAQNELLDMIFNCFRRHTYWSMKAFRAELRQPEAYLRETLEKVADLAKSGRFAMHWTLKPEYKLENYENTGDSVAPTTVNGTDGAEDTDLGDIDDDDDDDENVKMEDVLPL